MPAGSARECVRREPRSPDQVAYLAAIVCAMICSARALWRSCRQATAKRTSGTLWASFMAARTIPAGCAVTSWVREPGRIATSEPGSLALLRQEALSSGRSVSSSKYGWPT